MKKTLAFCMAAVMAGTLPLSMTALADGDAKDTMVVIDSEWYGTDMFQQDGWESAQSLIADSLFYRGSEDRRSSGRYLHRLEIKRRRSDRNV